MSNVYEVISYDDYLTQKYGDWRADLPEEQKRGHHYYEIFDMNRSYLDYKNKKGGIFMDKEQNSEKELVERKGAEKTEGETTETEKIKQQKVENKETIESKETSNEEETENTENGIEISNDVIAVIAGVAVSEVQGVASMSGGFAGGISEVLSGKKNMAKGIKVDKTDNKAKIDVNIIVEYGSRIPDVAFEIQNRVKKSVENMTGFKVEEVNVHVQGVNTEMTKKEEQSEEEQNSNE